MAGGVGGVSEVSFYKASPVFGSHIIVRQKDSSESFLVAFSTGLSGNIGAPGLDMHTKCASFPYVWFTLRGCAMYNTAVFPGKYLILLRHIVIDRYAMLPAKLGEY